VKIRALVAGLGALLGLACATPIPAERLPEQPLAFVHRTPAQGRERAELLQKRRGKALSSGEGVLNLNEIDDLMEHFRGRQERVSPELQGQMALYYAREERVELLDA